MKCYKNFFLCTLLRAKEIVVTSQMIKKKTNKKIKIKVPQSYYHGPLSFSKEIGL